MNQYVNTNSPILSEKTFSIDFWINHQGYIPTNRGTIISQYTLGASGRFLYWFNGGRLETNGDISNRVQKDPPINDGWYHTSIVFNNGNAELFFNGVSQGIIGTLNNNVHVGANTFIAGTYDTHFNGLIDQVRIYDYARTPAQIMWDYNRGGPVGHWRFNECQGNIIHDSSGNNYHGVFHVGPNGTQTSAGTCNSDNIANAWYNGREGVINSALSLDGIDDYVALPDTFGLHNSNFSVGFWYYHKTTSGQQYFFPLYGEISARFTTNSANNVMNFRGQNPSWNNILTAPPHNTEQWYHIFVTYSLVDGYKMYQDANLVDANSTTNQIVSRSDSSTIGYPPPNYQVNSLIDDVRIYNYALTEEQIKLLYNHNASVRF